MRTTGGRVVFQADQGPTRLGGGRGDDLQRWRALGGELVAAVQAFAMRPRPRGGH